MATLAITDGTRMGDWFAGSGATADLLAIGLVVFLILAMELVLFAIVWLGEDNL